MKIKKKWNILVIVLFLMLSSWALALLMSSYILQLVNNASELNKYIRAYYIAWWGVESELTKIKNHTFGYESSINSWSKINENFNKWVLNNYYMSGQVLSKSNVWASLDIFWLTDCSDKTKFFELKKWQWFIIPLYFDDVNPDPNSERYYWSWDENLKKIISLEDIKNIKIISTWNTLTNQTASWAITLLTSGSNNWMSVFENFDILSSNTKSFSLKNEYEIWQLFSSTAQILNDEKNHLILVSTNENASNILQKYCLEFWKDRSWNDLKLPWTITKILMHWHYWDRVVSLVVTKKTQLPEYLIYTSAQ